MNAVKCHFKTHTRSLDYKREYPLMFECFENTPTIFRSGYLSSSPQLPKINYSHYIK